MNLRPYQINALNAIYNRKVDRGIIALPTGCGKSVVASELHQVLNTNQILYLAHREELIDQLAEHMERVHGWGMVGVEQANRKCETTAPIVVASVPTLTASNCKRLHRLGTDRFRAIVVDEAHHGTADSYRQIWRYHGILSEDDSKPPISRIPLIGLTATPGRGDGVGLNRVFDEIIYQMKLAQAIKDGWLVPVHAWTIKTDTDLSQVRTRMGEYVESELAAAVSTTQRNSLILDAHTKQAHGLKTLIFCVNVEHSVKLADYFNANDIPAKYVAGTVRKDERANILKWFAETPGAVLTNCQIVTEGVDIPSVECVIMARPTKSATLYAQCLSADTEILTKRGFIGPDDYQDSDEVASFNLETSEIVFEMAQDKIDRPAFAMEHMYEYDTNMASIRVTGGHRMIHRVRQGRDRKNSLWKFITAENLANRSNSYSIPVSGHYYAPGIPLPDHDIRFIAWTFTDGSRNKYNNAIMITQNSDHEDGIKSIEETMNLCGFKYGRIEASKTTNFGDRTSIHYRYYVSHGKPRGTDKHLSGWGRLEPWMNTKTLSEMNDQQFSVFLEVANLADGSKQKQKYVSHGSEWTRRSYTITKRKQFIDWLQTMAAVRGYRTVSSGSGERYRVHLKKQDALYVGGCTSNDRPVLKMVDQIPNERVWCLTTRLGTLVIRRKGRVSIVGNCLGRGTRLAKGAYDYTESVKLGKDRCILLDIADTAEVGKRAVNVCDLFGSPFPDRPVKGENVLDVVEQQEMEIQDEENAKATAIAESMDLFSGALDIPGTRFSWFGSNQSIRLNLGRHGVVTASSDVLDRWTASYWDKESKAVTMLEFSGNDQQEFIAKVEDWIENHEKYRDCLGLINKKSRWRNDKPSKKQTDLCQKLGIFLPDNATKGMVSIALDRYFEKKNKRRAM